MSETSQNNNTVYCSFVSIHYIICECGETFPNEEDLKTHLETEHPHKIEKKEFSCGLCDESFTSEEACIRHHRTNHTVKIIKPPSPPPVTYIISPLNLPKKKEENMDSCMIVTSGKHPGTKAKKKKKYQRKNIKNKVCEVCGKKYASNAALRYHQRVHTGEKPYQCNYCEKAFTMPLFLQIHHRIHTGEKPYACPHCPKAFGNKAALLRHDRVHTGIKPYACPQCFKTFTQSNSMKLHVHTVHLRLPAPYKSKRRKERMAAAQEMRKAQRSGTDTLTAHTGRRTAVPRTQRAVPNSPIRIALPKARMVPRKQVEMGTDKVADKVTVGVKSWIKDEQEDEVENMCMVKSEDEEEYAEDEEVYYDHETGPEVLYEVVYQ